MPTSHIDTDYASMSHAIIPGSHCMVMPNGLIIEFGQVASRVHTRYICLQVFINDYTIAYLNRRVRQDLRVESDAKANTDHIGLDFSPHFRLYIAGDTVLGNYAFDFISMNDIDTELFRNVVDDFTTVRIKTVA